MNNPHEQVLLEKIHELQNKLSRHKVYENLQDLSFIPTFMQVHVFAVWDFMSLLKSLQRKLTCVDVPWIPSSYPASVVRMINEIALGEESDLGPDGQAISHFELYLQAMEEVGAQTQRIKEFLVTFEMDFVPHSTREFLTFNLNLAKQAPVHQVAAAFFYGREKLVPEMFTPMLQSLKASQQDYHSRASLLVYYLQRHIELDGGEHSELAQSMLESLCHHQDAQVAQQRKIEALETAFMSLKLRLQTWDHLLEMTSP